MLSERGVLLRPEANELRTGFADHTQNEVAENKCNHETKKCPNKEPTTAGKESQNKNTQREKTKMPREYKEDPMMKDKGKSIGQKQVEQMKRTREMSNEELKQSKKKQKKEERQDDTHRNIT